MSSAAVKNSQIEGVLIDLPFSVPRDISMPDLPVNLLNICSGSLFELDQVCMPPR